MARPLKALPKRQGQHGSRGQEPGFKLPLIFCLVLAACIALTWIFRQSVKQEPPAIDAELAEIASSWTLDLTDEQGGHLKEEMASAATGLDSHAAKDAKVGELGRRALDAGRIDAACAAVLFLHGPEMRLALLRDIERKATVDCATLPWGVFAVRNMAQDDPETARTLADELNVKWESCGRSLGPERQEGAPLSAATLGQTAGEGGQTDSQTDSRDDGQPESVIPPSRTMPASAGQDGQAAQDGQAGDEDRDDGREPARVLPSPDGTTEFGAHDDDDKPDDDAAPDEHDIKN
ncbi:MAG: hypothetical protein K6C33_09170 [Desulfovibrio sp.]|nr:hypothetical protein [Desulfovibrio sp.]